MNIILTLSEKNCSRCHFFIFAFYFSHFKHLRNQHLHFVIKKCKGIRLEITVGSTHGEIRMRERSLQTRGK